MEAQPRPENQRDRAWGQVPASVGDHRRLPALPGPNPSAVDTVFSSRRDPASTTMHRCDGTLGSTTLWQPPDLHDCASPMLTYRIQPFIDMDSCFSAPWCRAGRVLHGPSSTVSYIRMGRTRASPGHGCCCSGCLLNVDGGGKISRLEIIALLPSPPDTRMRMAPSSSTRSPSPSQLLL
ncbi:uncharacterized protein LOC123406233 isoform X2 [Hordeum vulgare subsp. vulgare]|uniref:uncharacterized protein LOC123406233 isoform X2 n=1 Tax=Hordeum vulgare subsp. vulgare TaxID=112509 RepID=UPI001D1A492D|nr:uncharacterized protein LOC123406233 isoform X2 [Hordeum vulgare subsp. vulgare]